MTPVTDPDQRAESLVEFCRDTDRATRAMLNNRGVSPAADWAYATPYGLVAAEGRPHRAAPRPADITRGPAGECYSNALALALDPPEGIDDEVVYCEGYAIGRAGVPVLHAWCVTYPDGDEDDPVVIDPTWETPETCTYLGIEFQTDFAWERTQTLGLYGLIANDHLDGSLLLRHGLADWPT